MYLPVYISPNNEMIVKFKIMSGLSDIGMRIYFATMLLEFFQLENFSRENVTYL